MNHKENTNRGVPGSAVLILMSKLQSKAWLTANFTLFQHTPLKFKTKITFPGFISKSI